MRKIIFTDNVPAALPEGNVKAGESMHLPEGRATELVGLGWAKPDGWEPGATFTPVPMYASSQPTKSARKAPASDTPSK